MTEAYPIIRDLGLCAKLVSFAAAFEDAANKAALAFAAAVEAQAWDGVEEVSTSLVSTAIRFDPLRLDPELLEEKLNTFLRARNWHAATPPEGRKLWRIPVVIDEEHGAQFAQAAKLVNLSQKEAKTEILNSRVRVLTLGFAPGQPYMGILPAHWNIPRMSVLNPQVPGGALVTAIGQLIIYAGPAPTGWRHLGQTAFECFRPSSKTPIALTPGDEVTFVEATPAELKDINETDTSGDGGATWEPIT